MKKLISSNQQMKKNPSIKIIFELWEKLNLPSRYQIVAFLNIKGKLIFQIFDGLGDPTSKIPKIIPNTDMYEGAYNYIEMYNLLKNRRL